MFEQDYVMRLIKEMVRVILKPVFDGAMMKVLAGWLHKSETGVCGGVI